MIRSIRKLVASSNVVKSSSGKFDGRLENRLMAHLYPHLLILLPSPCTRGEGLGVRGFVLYFDWFFDREFNV